MMYDTNSPPQRRIIVNGEKGHYFPIKSGVAQGCPLSPLLFLVCAEVILRLAKKHLKGIRVNRKKYKASAFADDTVLLLGGIKDLKKVWGLLKRYNGATGMLANAKKTEGLALGKMKKALIPDTPIIKKAQWAKEGDTIVCLGVPIGRNIDETAFWD